MTYKTFILAFAIIIFVGCSKKKFDTSLLDVAVQEKPDVPVLVSQEEKRKESAVVKKRLEKVNNAQFSFDGYSLSNSSIEILGDIAGTMLADESLNILISGGCCPVGAYGYNLALGQHRALACQAYLVSAGIDPIRIACVSFGEEDLLTEFEPEYWKNRRAEFEFKFNQ